MKNKFSAVNKIGDVFFIYILFMFGLFCFMYVVSGCVFSISNIDVVK